MPEPAATIVFVDDDDSFRSVMQRELRRMGFSVVGFANGDGVGEHVAAAPPDVVILDLKMPGRSGLEILHELREADPELQVVVLTGHGAVADAVEAMRRGAVDFLTKPVSLDILEQALLKAVGTARLRAENRRLRRLAAAGTTATIELTSAASRKLEAEIERVGPTEKSVLIQGESGVGKELVARMLHQSSPRASGPFVAINCAAIPRQLIESELFGHRRGAFTGADAGRVGLFEAADHGTLFLDEVGELGTEVQPALLRALQFGEIRPVGSDTVRIVDVRIIAATNRNLREMVQAAGFREDLFFRLAVFELQVTPLRERPEDIPVLARYFLLKENRRGGRMLSLAPDAEQALRRSDWPGNIRQLENAMVRVAVLAQGPTVSAAEIEQLLAPGARPRQPSAELPTLCLRDLEYVAIEAALARHGGNKSRAAEELGIALKTLYNKLNKAASKDSDA